MSDEKLNLFILHLNNIGILSSTNNTTSKDFMNKYMTVNSNRSNKCSQQNELLLSEKKGKKFKEAITKAIIDYIHSLTNDKIELMSLSIYNKFKESMIYKIYKFIKILSKKVIQNKKKINFSVLKNNIFYSQIKIPSLDFSEIAKINDDFINKNSICSCNSIINNFLNINLSTNKNTKKPIKCKAVENIFKIQSNLLSSKCLKEKKELQQCTFKPNINKTLKYYNSHSAKHKNDNNKNSNKILNNKNKENKENYIHEGLYNTNYNFYCNYYTNNINYNNFLSDDDLTECTFQPKLISRQYNYKKISQTPSTSFIQAKHKSNNFNSNSNSNKKNYPNNKNAFYKKMKDNKALKDKNFETCRRTGTLSKSSSNIIKKCSSNVNFGKDRNLNKLYDLYDISSDKLVINEKIINNDKNNINDNINANHNNKNNINYSQIEKLYNDYKKSKEKKNKIIDNLVVEQELKSKSNNNLQIINNDNKSVNKSLNFNYDSIINNIKREKENANNKNKSNVNIDENLYDNKYNFIQKQQIINGIIQKLYSTTNSKKCMKLNYNSKANNQNFKTCNNNYSGKIVFNSFDFENNNSNKILVKYNSNKN